MEYYQADTMLRKNCFCVTTNYCLFLKRLESFCFFAGPVFCIDPTERVSELGVHSIPLHRDMAETSSWPCTNSHLKTAHRLQETRIYRPFTRDRGMGKHRGEPLDQETNSNSLRACLHNSPAELTTSILWNWLQWVWSPGCKCSEYMGWTQT